MPFDDKQLVFVGRLMRAPALLAAVRANAPFCAIFVEEEGFGCSVHAEYTYKGTHVFVSFPFGADSRAHDEETCFKGRFRGLMQPSFTAIVDTVTAELLPFAIASKAFTLPAPGASISTIVQPVFAVPLDPTNFTRYPLLKISYSCFKVLPGFPEHTAAIRAKAAAEAVAAAAAAAASLPLSTVEIAPVD